MMQPWIAGAILLLSVTLAWGQAADTLTQMDAYLDGIRPSQAELRAFFEPMPKGGDLHHHYSGSIYAETYLRVALEQDMWLHQRQLRLSAAMPTDLAGWARLSVLQKSDRWPELRRDLLRAWSAYQFDEGRGVAAVDHFFATFDRFTAAAKADYRTGLLALKARAKAERVSYLETIFEPIDVPITFAVEAAANEMLWALQREQQPTVQDSLAVLYRIFRRASRHEDHNRWLTHLHRGLALDDSTFTLRYQNYVVRVLDPVTIFKQLIACFESAQHSDLVAGVNIVAPEHHPVAVRDYWLHMQMFRFLGQQYPDVRYSLHAGELTLGQVPPEELRWHIDAAVRTAGAHRIGHGVDIAHETDRGTLEYLRDHDLAVEINLSSNAFLLGLSPADHPLRLYHRHGVPMIICTDDAGVLRTDLTQQYVLLAYDHPNFRYRDIRELVLNSIRYSFLPPAAKQQHLRRLERALQQFEANILQSTVGG